MNLFEFFKLKFTLKNYSNSTFLCWKTKSPTFWGWSPLQKYFHRQEKVFETRIYFPRVGINFRRAGELKTLPKISARKLILCELLRFNLTAAIILRGKDYGQGKFLWKKIRKESFMFWLRNWSYLIMSSSSSTLLLDILIFHSQTSVFVLFNNVPFLPLLDSIICKRTICRKIFLFNFVFICFWVAVIYKSEIP